MAAADLPHQQCHGDSIRLSFMSLHNKNLQLHESEWLHQQSQVCQHATVKTFIYRQHQTSIMFLKSFKRKHTQTGQVCSSVQRFNREKRKQRHNKRPWGTAAVQASFKWNHQTEKLSLNWPDGWLGTKVRGWPERRCMCFKQHDNSWAGISVLARRAPPPSQESNETPLKQALVRICYYNTQHLTEPGTEVKSSKGYGDTAVDEVENLISKIIICKTVKEQSLDNQTRILKIKVTYQARCQGCFWLPFPP